MPDKTAITLDDPIASSILLPLRDAGAGRKTSVKLVGGKAASLGKLVREGFAVPEGWVIDARRFTRMAEETLPKGHDLATLIKQAGTRPGVDRAARARDRVLSAPLPDAIRDALAKLVEAAGPSAPWGFAVRSSATCEDMTDTSLAGLASTVLGVRSLDALADAIREVWASAFLPRALAYLAHAGVRDLAMAVVIQVMVRAEAAGVLFSAPPAGLGGDRVKPDERLINATFGLGAPVVEGAIATDTYRLAKSNGALVDAAIARKTSALVVGPAGPVVVALDDARANAPALGAAALKELARIVDRLERSSWKLFEGAKGAPLDVEFAVEGEGEGSPGSRVWLLQARPVTGGGYPEGGDAETIWSRANVGEALPGAATPLTWSIARSFSDKGFREAFSALGCNVPRGAVLVTNVLGRFYLNLTTFVRIAAQVPGITPRALLTASGGADEGIIRTLEAQIEGVSQRGFFAKLPLLIPRQITKQLKLEAEVAAFEVEADRAVRALADMDLSLYPDDGLVTTLKGARARLDRTGTLMLSCASASLASHVLLCRALERVLGPRAREGHSPERAAWGSAEPLAQALLGGVRELDSAEPGILLAQAARAVRDDAAAKDAILAGGARAPSDLPEGPGRRAALSLLAAVGDRAVREADLATPRWSEDPGPLMAMLAASVRAGEADPEQALRRARSTADREMARLEANVSPIPLALIRSLIGWTQRFTRLRERMRTWVSRVLGMIRRIALDADRRLRRIDPSLPPGSVFFCTYEELIAALGSGRAEIGHVVRLRRAEHARDAARPDPPPTFIGRPEPVQLPPAQGMRLTGLPASGGVVEGIARVLGPGATGLDEVSAGEILVSRTTDVGLSPLFLVAAAVVTELGGPLSHAAVVAREYGVPAVVNVPGVTVAIRTGDKLRVDGDRGIVERLEN